MKKLTQAIFNDAPSWVKSAAVDKDGAAFWYEDDAEYLILHGAEFSNFLWSSSKKYLGHGFDKTDWENSAINKA